MEASKTVEAPPKIPAPAPAVPSTPPKPAAVAAEAKKETPASEPKAPIANLVTESASGGRSLVIPVAPPNVSAPPKVPLPAPVIPPAPPVTALKSDTSPTAAPVEAPKAPVAPAKPVTTAQLPLDYSQQIME